MQCKVCNASLTYNEMGLCKKLLGKNTKQMFCKKCLAAHLHVTEKLLEEKQQQFLQSGCTLFVKE